MNSLIRQGDVLLVPVDSKPQNNAKTTNKVILAEGEVTGHNHVLEAKNMITWGDFVCIPDGETGVLSHPDHDPEPVAVVPAGTYQIVHQREYTLSGMWEQVRD